MPTIDITIKRGVSDAALEKCMKEITDSAEKLLENTYKRMIRISIFEAEDGMVMDGGKIENDLCPTAVFTIGPGRSEMAKQKFAQSITEILADNLKCNKDKIRVYTLSSYGNHFAIGGNKKK